MMFHCRPRAGYHRAGWLALAVLEAGLFLASGALAAQQTAPTAPPALAFREVTVIDVTDGRRLPNQTVVVVGKRVRAIGPAAKVRVPQGAQVVDATGKYMIPGLWDMHAHPEHPGGTQMYQSDLYRRNFILYIAHGITGIRELAQRWPHGSDSFRVWQREIQAGTLVGPRNIGPSTDLGGLRRITTEDAVRRVIDSLKAAGDAFVKFHGSSGVPDNDTTGYRARIFAMLREGRRVGLPIVGHLPEGVTNVEAADSGMRSIEHTHGTQRQCWPGFATPLPDSATFDRLCAPVAQAYVRNGTWVVPTLSGEGNAVAEEFWRRMHRLGVRNFLAGTDILGNGTGWGGREELVLLVDAGLTPLEALQAGTLNPARLIEATDSLGTVAVGKLADLVLLDGDPLADITNVLRLWGVVANGRYFDQETLKGMDPQGFKAVDRVLEKRRRGGRGRSVP